MQSRKAVARAGRSKTGSAKTGAAKWGSAKSGSAKSGSAKLGSAKTGSAKSGSAKAGSARSPAADRRPRRSGEPQLELALSRGWGGKRKGAGRKPKGARAGVSHRNRPALASRFPVHATWRMRSHVYNLRSRRCFRQIRRAFVDGRERGGFRLVHFSVQGNHLHLIVEARDAAALARGLQGMAVRIARRLNAVMGRRGKVFADRYHAHHLKTPREVRNAIEYVLGNAAVHARRQGRAAASEADRFASARYLLLATGSMGQEELDRLARGDPWAPLDRRGPAPPVCAPRTWLLTAGLTKRA